MALVLAGILTFSIFMGCSNPVTAGSKDSLTSAYPDPAIPVTAVRSAVVTTNWPVRLVYARPETSTSGVEMIHFKVHTLKGKSTNYSSPTSVDVKYWDYNIQQWRYFWLSKLYDGVNYTDYEGTMNAGYCLFVIDASWLSDDYNDTNGAMGYYKVCNSGDPLFSFLQPIGYQNGAVGGNVGVSEARVRYDGATMSYTLMVQVVAERLQPSMLVGVWYGRTANEAFTEDYWRATEKSTVYAGSEKIVFENFTFTGLTKTNTAHFYTALLGSYNNCIDMNFGNTYQVSLTDGNVMR